MAYSSLELLLSDEDIAELNKDRIKRTGADCLNCTLLENCFVPEETYGSKICFVAEAPGGTEVEEGRPLIGPAGKVINRCIETLGYKREDFDYQNSVLCRPTVGTTKNRTPTSEEVASCNARLLQETSGYVTLIALGKTAYEALTGKTDIRVKDIASMANPTMALNGVPVFGTYHPAAVLYGHKKGDNDIELMIRHAIKKAVRQNEKLV